MTLPCKKLNVVEIQGNENRMTNTVESSTEVYVWLKKGCFANDDDDNDDDDDDDDGICKRLM
jgi:hypothetical protein